MKKGYFFAILCLFTFLLAGNQARAQATLTVTITPPPASPPFCTGNFYQFTGNANPGPILFYQWSSLPSAGVNIVNPNQSGTNIQFNNTGTYTLTLIASNTSGTKDSIKYTLSVTATPTVIASPPQGAVICLGGTGTNLYATGASTYTWSGTGITTTFANGDSTNVNPSSAGIFTYTVTGSQGGCVSSPVMLTATVNPAPTPTITIAPDTICSTSSTTITVSGMPSTTTYTWSAQPTAGLGTNSGGWAPATPVFFGSNDSTFNYQINMAVPGCPTYPTYTAALYVIPTPTVYAVSDTVDNCNKMGDSLRVTSIPPQSSGTTYTWSPATGLGSTSGNPVYANPLNPIRYYVTPIYKGCVGLRDSIQVMIGDTTIAQIDAQYLIICAGQPNMLVGLPALGQLNNSYTYSWAPTTGPSTVTPINAQGDTVIITPIATTIYTLTVFGTCVKKKETTLTIYVNNCSPLINTDFTMNTDTICVNHCIYFSDLTHDFNVLPLFYQWIFTGGNPVGIAGQYTVSLPDTAYYAATDSTPIPSIKVCYKINSSLNANGVFPVVMNVANGLGQTATVTHYVKVDAGPLANAGPNVTINLGDSIQLNGTYSTGNFAITQYVWSPTDSLHCDIPPYLNNWSCPKPWANPSETTTYYLTVKDKNGCYSKDSMIVYVDLKCYDPFIPSAFSPNGDGQNDELFVRSNCLQNFVFKVYDRWGEKVFESNSLNFGWDGSFRGTPVNAGVFVWTLEGFLSNGKEVKKHGSTTVIR